MQLFIANNAILATGKYLLSEAAPKAFESTKPLFAALASIIGPGNPGDSRRLALVVVRTASRRGAHITTEKTRETSSEKGISPDGPRQRCGEGRTGDGLNFHISEERSPFFVHALAVTWGFLERN